VVLGRFCTHRLFFGDLREDRLRTVDVEVGPRQLLVVVGGGSDDVTRSLGADVEGRGRLPRVDGLEELVVLQKGCWEWSFRMQESPDVGG
jgi:hypothetical protein